MLERSVKHSLGRWWGEKVDTFTLRTYLMLVVLAEYLPAEVVRTDNRVAYEGIVYASFMLTVFLYVFGPAINFVLALRNFALWLHNMEYRVEFYLRAHHFAIILVLLVSAGVVAKIVA